MLRINAATTTSQHTSRRCRDRRGAVAGYSQLEDTPRDEAGSPARVRRAGAFAIYCSCRLATRPTVPTMTIAAYGRDSSMLHKLAIHIFFCVQVFSRILLFVAGRELQREDVLRAERLDDGASSPQRRRPLDSRCPTAPSTPSFQRDFTVGVSLFS